MVHLIGIAKLGSTALTAYDIERDSFTNKN